MSPETLRPGDVAEIERVAAISDVAFRRVARVLAAAISDGSELWLEGAPLTVGRLRGEVAATFSSAGLRQPEGNLIAVGGEAAEPHHEGDDQRRIGAADGVLVDLFPRSGDLEHPVFSDCSRTFCVGVELEATQSMRRAAAHVVEVKELVERALASELASHGSAVGFSLHTLACSAFRERGWQAQVTADGVVQTIEDGYVHGLGHGVGRAVHQPPTFSSEFADRAEGLIEIGHVITIEPGLYQTGEFGVRYEDLFVVEAAARSAPEPGATDESRPDTARAVLRRLTKLPWALDPKEFLTKV